MVRSAQEIEKEINALYTSVDNHMSNFQEDKAHVALNKARNNVEVLETSWKQAKKENQHLVEQTRKNFESEIYKIVEEIKTVEEKYS